MEIVKKFLKQFPEKSVQLVFFSPPYSDISGKYLNGYKGVPPNEYVNWLLPKIKEMSRVIRDAGSIIINLGSKVENRFECDYPYELVYRVNRETDLRLFSTLFWNKGKGLVVKNRFWQKVEFILWFVKNKDFVFNFDEMRVPYSDVSLKRMKSPIKKRFARNEENQNSRDYKEWSSNPLGASPSNLLNIGSVSTRICDNHVASFPLALADYFIKGASNVGDVVLDPFAGTFTTCLSAKNLGRNYCGIDLNQSYCDFGTKRLLSVQIPATIPESTFKVEPEIQKTLDKIEE